MNLNQLNVLYVEDEARSRKVMRMVTRFAGITNLTVFEDSADFVDRVQALEPKPDLVFLDIHVQPHSGFEMLAMLRELDEFTDVPIVAMTASVMNEEISQLQTSGFNGCLAKPLEIETFADSVEAIMNGETIWRVTA